MLPYRDTVFYFIVDLCTLLRNMYYNNIADKIDIDNISSNKIYLDNKYLTLCNIYLGTYYAKLKKFDTAKSYFDQASFNLKTDNTYLSIYYYRLSSFYALKYDMINAINYNNLAIQKLAEEQNFNRLLNQKITTANQYIFMRDFHKSIEYNKENLVTAQKLNLKLEERSILYNLGYAYFFLNDYKEACKYFSKISNAYINFKHYYSYILTLLIIKDYDKAKEVYSESCLLEAKNPYQVLFNHFDEFFKDNDLSSLAKNSMKFYNKNKQLYTNGENSFLLTFLYHAFEDLKQYKKAFIALKELYNLTK